MANIITNIPLTYRETDGNLISPIKGKPTEVSEAVASDLKNAGLAEDYSGGGSGAITIAQKQSVTTAMQGAFPPVARGSITLAEGAVSTKTIDVIFDGVEYKNVPCSASGYGEMKNHLPDFTNYPFFVINKGPDNQWMLATATAGSYEIEIKGTPTNVPYWNCHVTVTNEKNDTDLFVEGFIIDPANGEGKTTQQVTGTSEFDVIAVDGVAYLHFTNSNGDDGIVTSVTGKGADAEDGRVGVWGDVTITAKGSE